VAAIGVIGQSLELASQFHYRIRQGDKTMDWIILIIEPTVGGERAHSV
jgi:hypothetical protein